MAPSQIKHDHDILFISNKHKDFFYDNLKKMPVDDVYHRALIYCLGINNDTRSHITDIFDFENDSIKTQCLFEGWQTGGSMKVTRMAFNLYSNCAPSVNEDDTCEEKEAEYTKYLPDELFCCSYAPFFWQTIKIRYPVETTYNAELHGSLGSLD